MTKFTILDHINSPAELRALPSTQLAPLAIELRQFMIEALNVCGGHFAGGLGAVELTIALHTVFNTPEDKLVWDVGHQAYPHKILTGRKSQLHTIKRAGGLAPFPKREESPYDTFGVGHSSTSISAALGMALGFQAKNMPNHSIAIIGDGGLTGGMAFEALNHAGSTDANLLIILNDNDMSISPNVGALNNYLTRILTGKAYTSLREGSKKMLEKVPPMKNLAKRTETHLKGMIAPGTLFEELGINYYGPIDGHDLDILIPTLTNLRELTGPRLLHVVTSKGKGYAKAECDPVKYHAVKPGFYTIDLAEATKSVDHTTSKKPLQAPKKVTYSEVFGHWLCELAKTDKRLIGITPAMREGSGMVEFAKQFPAQYIDVGIAEQHSVTLAAGLACEDQKPVVAIYSTFLQRAYDQLIHDVALQNLDVTFALDRAGLVGADGPTHAGSFDISYLRCIPNMVIMAPSDEIECWNMLSTGYQYPGPAAIRYPRGTGLGLALPETLTTLPLGKGVIKRQGQQVAILAFGTLLHPALVAAEKLNATVIDMRFVKPLDTQLISRLAEEHDILVTLEENATMGGAGSAVNEHLAAMQHNICALNLGLPDSYIEHGDPSQMLADCGLDAVGIERRIKVACKTLIYRSQDNSVSTNC